MTFAIAMVGAVLGAASMILHALVVKYPGLKKAADVVDEAEALVPQK